MTYTTVPTKIAGDPLTAALWNASVRDNLNKGVMRPIAETTLGAPAASIVFSSIPADLSHLALRLFCRGDQVASFVPVNMQVNGDSGNNYDNQWLISNGASGAPLMQEAVGVGIIRAGSMVGANALASVWCSIALEIPGYASTAGQKAILTKSAYKTNTATTAIYMEDGVGFWRNTAAISSLTLISSVGNFLTGTKATLYGAGGA